MVSKVDMGRKIVLRNEIDLQILKMNSLSQELNGNSDFIRTSLSSLANSFRRSGGKSTIVISCMNTTSAINSVADSLTEGARLLELSKNSYRNLDAVLRAEFNNTDYPVLNGLSFGDANSDQGVYDSIEDYWDSLLGTTLADINGDFYHSKNMSYCADPGLKGQCTWYAYGRFYETMGIRLNTARHAYNWLNDNNKDGRLNVLYNNSPDVLKDQKIPCIAVSTSGKYGHVSIIENIIYNDDGTIKAVYMSQSNADGNPNYNAGVDAVLQKLVPGTPEFQKYFNGLAGFICAK